MTKLIKTILKGLYIDQRFYYIGSAIVVLFVLSFFLPLLFMVSQILLFVLLGVTLLDILLLFRTDSGIHITRMMPEKLSNGDKNLVTLQIKNLYNFEVIARVIDEIPEEFQIRDFNITTTLHKGKMTDLPYQIRPTFRGLVEFGNIHAYISSPIKLAQRKYTFDTKKDIPVYPSYLQLKKYEFLAFSNRIFQHGLKKVRRLGHTMEFEKIKEYVPGDDIRTVNWKSTAKSNKLMVNLYQDERSQSIYCILDAGRVMKMPFEGLSLLDYAINAILVLSSIALRKQDYAGFFSFSKKIENRVAADRRTYQMKNIMEALYNVKTDFYESDYSRLFRDVKKNIPQRSLLLLFTNFETIDGLQRQLPYLKAIARSHLLIIIFFNNTEMDTILYTRSENTEEIFDKIIAEKLNFEKKLIVQELQKFGIHTILTKPEDLTIETINMYLEIKAKGMI